MLHPTPHITGTGKPIVEINGVTCGYEKQRVLSDVSLNIMPGDFLGLWAPADLARRLFYAPFWERSTCMKARCWSTALRRLKNNPESAMYPN